jgi:uncharacterized protein YceK
MQTHTHHRWAKYAALLFMVAVVAAVLNGCSSTRVNIEPNRCFTRTACDVARG